VRTLSLGRQPSPPEHAYRRGGTPTFAAIRTINPTCKLTLLYAFCAYYLLLQGRLLAVSYSWSYCTVASLFVVLDELTMNSPVFLL
jgi:hypothetical protein